MSVPRFTIVALIAAAVAIAVWPESETDRAREDREQLGEAVSQLYYAESSAEVDAALTELDEAARPATSAPRDPEVQEAFWEGYEEGLSG